MPSTAETQAYNRGLTTLLIKGDKLARQCGAKVAISLRRNNKLVAYRTEGFWLSKEEIVRFPFFSPLKLTLQDRAYPLPRWIHSKDLQSKSKLRTRRNECSKEKSFSIL